MSEGVKTLWDTYDFILGQIVSLESQYSSLITHEEIDFPFRISEFQETCTRLNSAYNKQLHTIKELKNYYEDRPEDVPSEREVAVEHLVELEEVTLDLKDVIARSLDSYNKKFDN